MGCILHVPHSSSILPDEERSAILLSDADLNLELLRMTDWFTDELFALDSNRFPMVRFPVSRLIVDPERFVDDAQERMVEQGMGVIYTKTSNGAPLRAAIDPAQRTRLIQRFYIPHHKELSRLVAESLERRGKALIVDCHSFPSVPLPYEPDQEPARPEICLGTDPFHTPRNLADYANEVISRQGALGVMINRPFSGALVPAEFYKNDSDVQALMIEVNRGLYMNEETGKKLDRFAAIQKTLQHVVSEIALYFEENSK